MPARRLSIPLAILLLLTCASIAFFVFFGRDFPPTMAVHFGLGGRANGYMDRVKFIVLGSFLSFMLPTFIVTMVGVMPRVLPLSMLSLPNKQYWLSPERREQTLDAMLWFGLWLGCLVQGFLMTVDIGIYRANLVQPPVLNAAGVAVGLPSLLFVLAIVVWGVALARSFAMPRANLR